MRNSARIRVVLLCVCILLAFSTAALAIECPVCGTNNRNSSIYCRKCGAELRPAEGARFKGPKKTIAVLSFENKTSYEGKLALGEDFSEQLTEALVNSGQFTVVTRRELEAVMTEQDLSATNRVAESKTALKGKLIPAQLIIKGAVTGFESQATGGGTDVRFGNFGAGDFGISGETVHAHVACIVYIIDSSTGQVLDSERVEGKARAGGLGFDWEYDDTIALGTAGFKKTPLGKAMKETIDEAVRYIAAELASLPWEGRVVKAEESTVYINAGAGDNVQKGDVFTVYGESEVLTDPMTGLMLGSEKSESAKIIVNEVNEKFSKATITESCGTVTRGDLIMLE